MKKTGIIILIVVLILLIISFGNLLIRAIIHRGDDFNFMGEVERKEEWIRKEEKADIQGIEEIDIKTINSDARIILTDEEEIRVVQYANKELKENELFQMIKNRK